MEPESCSSLFIVLIKVWRWIRKHGSSCEVEPLTRERVCSLWGVGLKPVLSCLRLLFLAAVLSFFSPELGAPQFFLPELPFSISAAVFLLFIQKLLLWLKLQNLVFRLFCKNWVSPSAHRPPHVLPNPTTKEDLPDDPRSPEPAA